MDPSPNPATCQWFYIHAGTQRGPVSGEELNSAEIGPDTLVWSQGMPQWARAIDTPLFQHLFGTPPPLPASSSPSPTPPTELPLEAPLLVPSAPTPAPLYTPPSATEAEVTAPAPQPQSQSQADCAPQTPATEAQSHGNYMVRHWRGEHSLARAYWVNCFIVTSVYTFLLTILVGTDPSLTVWALGMLTAYALSYPLAVWQVTGLIRSLGNHLQLGGSRVTHVLGWLAAVIMVVVSVTQTFVTVLPQSGVFIEILRGDPAIGKMRIELLPSGTEVEISGGIPAGSAAEFQNFIDKAPRVTVLHIDSVGGRIREAKEIADIVRSRRMTTYVARECLSAATMIFLAGEERFVLSGAKLGFHAASMPGLTAEELRKVNASLYSEMLRAGVTREFAALAQITPSTTMWYPTVEELLKGRVITGLTHGERFGVSSATLRALPDAETALLKQPFFKAIKEKDPNLYAVLMKAFRDSLERGASEADTVAKLHSLIAERFDQAFLLASDAALCRSIDLSVLVIDRCKDEDPALVLAILSKDPNARTRNPVRVLKNYPLREEQEFMVDVILNPLPAPPKIDKVAGAADLEKVVSHMVQTSLELSQVFRDLEKHKEHPAKALDALRLYFDSVRTTVPLSRRANALRYAMNTE